MIKLWNSCEQQHIALIQAMHEFMPTGILHLNANLHRFQTFFPQKNLPLNIPLEKQNMEWNDNNSYTKRAMWVLCRGASPHMGGKPTMKFKPHHSQGYRAWPETGPPPGDLFVSLFNLHFGGKFQTKERLPPLPHPSRRLAS